MAVPVLPPRVIDLPRQCRRVDGVAKTLYPTRDIARSVVRRYRAGSKGLHAYPCEHCPGYHVGRRKVARGG